MSMGAALTEVATIKKIFSWTIDNNIQLQKENLTIETCEFYGSIYVLQSPQMSATDPYSKVVYTGSIKLRFRSFPGEAKLSCCFDPDPKCATFFSYQINDGEVKRGNWFQWSSEIKKITIFVDANVTRSKIFDVVCFKRNNFNNLGNQLMKMYKEDLSVKFTIQSGTTVIEAIKPIMMSQSIVFKAMFETDMKEKAQNVVKITDFEGKIVQKMVEFCETDTIENVENSEIELFKIAHKYRIQELMDFALEKMTKSISTSKLPEYLRLADLYNDELNDFKEWCMKFAVRNNIIIFN